MSVAVSPKANLNLLYPSFAAKVSKLLEICRSIDIPILIYCGLRTAEEQDALYQQGRNGTGKTVTNARAYESLHNFGLAVDFCKNVKGQEYTDEKFFLKVGEFAESLGLIWGGRWTKFKDMPHIEDRTFGDALELKKKFGNLEAFLKTWSGGK
jgi:peptidoglycan L-alanyl-D-glutamate endopeptidase CwlK